jgi:hypothetical protein
LPGLAWIPVHDSAEPDSIAVRIPLADRAELLSAAPKTYYIKEHYVDYAAVLVRLPHIQPDALRALLGVAYQSMNAKPAKAPRQSPIKSRNHR